ncbi:MAG: glycine cleavage system aminomethyltransferase GcvT [Bdellovibrio sp.]
MNQNLKETILINEHKKLNARLVNFAGFNMPVQYSSVKEECEAVRKKAGVFDVSHMGEFWVKGPDAARFVDYLVTNDFLNLPESKAMYSPLCNHEGKILDDLIAYKFSNQEALICVNASNIQKDWNWMVQFQKNFNILFENQSETTSLLALQGPQSESILENYLKTDLSTMDYYSVRRVTYEGREYILARTGYTGEDGFEIFCANNDVTSLWNALLAAGVVACGLAARDVLRLEVCYPLYGNDLSEELTPLETGLRWTVKLDKPDFIGKNALSSFVPSKKLIKYTIDKGIPRQGYEILDNEGKVVGSTTSGTHSVALGKGIGMGLISSSVSNKEPLFLNVRNQKLPILIQTKPFVIGGHK